MKYKYALFAYDGYYPSGGMNDMKLLFNEKQEVLDKVKHIRYDFYELFDLENYNISKLEMDLRSNKEEDLSNFRKWIIDLIQESSS